MYKVDSDTIYLKRGHITLLLLLIIIVIIIIMESFTQSPKFFIFLFFALV